MTSNSASRLVALPPLRLPPMFRRRRSSACNMRFGLKTAGLKSESCSFSRGDRGTLAVTGTKRGEFLPPAIEFDGDQIGVGCLDARKQAIPKEGCCGGNLHETCEQRARAIQFLKGDISCWHKAGLSFCEYACGPGRRRARSFAFNSPQSQKKAEPYKSGSSARGIRAKSSRRRLRAAR